VRQRNEGIIVGPDAGPPAIEVGVHVGHGSKQDQGLVDEVTPKIEEQPTGFVSRTALAPATRRDGPPSFES
jgi:hypothetical protein